MHVSVSVVLAALATPFLVCAGGSQNPFNVPPGGYPAIAGKSLSLSWNPTTKDTVTLVLRSGDSASLLPGTYIAQSIQNSGSYSWSIPNTITNGNYTVEIVVDADPSEYNFTPMFHIDSTFTDPTTTGTITFASVTESLSTSFGTATTGSATTGTTTTTNGSASTAAAVSMSSSSSPTSSPTTAVADLASGTTAAALAASTGAASGMDIPFLAAGAFAIGAMIL